MKILLVDDEKNILSALYRQLRRQFTIDLALGGIEGLSRINKNGPYAVVVSDLRMPVMDGIRFLRKVKIKDPNTVRIILTGNADQQSAIDAINKGEAFRFLTKPCPKDMLVNTLKAGIDQYRLITSEKELLENTLSGSIKVLADMLSLVNPTAFGRTQFIKDYVNRLINVLNIDESWQYNISAMLSMIGCITIPKETLEKHFSGENVSDEEKKLLQDHPKIAAKLIENIPRLENIAKIIEAQTHPLDPITAIKNVTAMDEIELGGQLLKVATDFDLYLNREISAKAAKKKMLKKKNEYHRDIIRALQTIKIAREKTVIKSVYLNQLLSGMILKENIFTNKNIMIVSEGHIVNLTTIQRLKSFKHIYGIKEPFQVEVKQKTS